MATLYPPDYDSKPTFTLGAGCWWSGYGNYFEYPSASFRMWYHVDMDDGGLLKEPWVVEMLERHANSQLLTKELEAEFAKKLARGIEESKQPWDEKQIMADINDFAAEIQGIGTGRIKVREREWTDEFGSHYEAKARGRAGRIHTQKVTRYLMSGWGIERQRAHGNVLKAAELDRKGDIPGR